MKVVGMARVVEFPRATGAYAEEDSRHVFVDAMFDSKVTVAVSVVEPHRPSETSKQGAERARVNNNGVKRVRARAYIAKSKEGDK